MNLFRKRRRETRPRKKYDHSMDYINDKLFRDISLYVAKKRRDEAKKFGILLNTKNKSENVDDEVLKQLDYNPNYSQKQVDTSNNNKINADLGKSQPNVNIKSSDGKSYPVSDSSYRTINTNTSYNPFRNNAGINYNRTVYPTTVYNNGWKPNSIFDNGLNSQNYFNNYNSGLPPYNRFGYPNYSNILSNYNNLSNYNPWQYPRYPRYDYSPYSSYSPYSRSSVYDPWAKNNPYMLQEFSNNVMADNNELMKKILELEREKNREEGIMDSIGNIAYNAVNDPKQMVMGEAPNDDNQTGWFKKGMAGLLGIGASLLTNAMPWTGAITKPIASALGNWLFNQSPAARRWFNTMNLGTEGVTNIIPFLFQFDNRIKTNPEVANEPGFWDKFSNYLKDKFKSKTNVTSDQTPNTYMAYNQAMNNKDINTSLVDGNQVNRIIIETRLPNNTKVGAGKRKRIIINCDKNKRFKGGAGPNANDYEKYAPPKETWYPDTEHIDSIVGNKGIDWGINTGGVLGMTAGFTKNRLDDLGNLGMKGVNLGYKGVKTVGKGLWGFLYGNYAGIKSGFNYMTDRDEIEEIENKPEEIVEVEKENANNKVEEELNKPEIVEKINSDPKIQKDVETILENTEKKATETVGKIIGDIDPNNTELKDYIKTSSLLALTTYLSKLGILPKNTFAYIFSLYPKPIINVVTFFYPEIGELLNNVSMSLVNIVKLLPNQFAQPILNKFNGDSPLKKGTNMLFSLIKLLPILYKGYNLFMGYGRRKNITNTFDDDALSNYDIENIVKNEYNNWKDCFGGCFCWDELKLPIKMNKDRWAIIVCTLDSEDDPEEIGHWVSIVIDNINKTIMYYDSFGDEPKNKDEFINDIKKFKKYINEKYQLKINRIKNQNVNSNNCGYFAIYFIDNILRKNKSFRKATNFNSIEGEKKIYLLKQKFNMI